MRPMDDSSEDDRRADLYAELEQVTARMWALITPTSQLQVGPVHVRRRIGSQAFAKIFVLLNLALGVTGGVLIFTDGKVADLGIALVVGAAFSLGAFVSAVWSLTVEAERNRYSAMVGDEVRREMRQLQERHEAIRAQLSEASRQNGEVERQEDV